MATIGIDSRVSDIYVAPDDLVARARTGRGNLIGASHVVVIHIAMNAAVAVEIVVVHLLANDVPVDLNVSVVVVDVDVGDVNVRTAASDPAPALPAMIVNAVAGPVVITIQPRPDGQSSPKGDDASRIQDPEKRATPDVNDIRVVRRH